MARGATPSDPGRHQLKLFVFGGSQLVGANDEPLGDLLAQTKLLAFLVYVILATPRGFHRRERMVGLLWPELDEPHARGALRKALHAVKQAVGEAVLETRGDEEIGIAFSGIWCDAIAFEEAIEAGHAARALDVYRGELLPGFFVRGAPEFDQWLEQERSRYQRQAATAAWILAERSEEEERATIAADWARRSVAMAPFEERVVRKAIALLGRVGDRAGAVALYEAFRARIAREFDVQPAAETTALIRQIRER
jgi:serine/threonine-protein kinase